MLNNNEFIDFEFILHSGFYIRQFNSSDIFGVDANCVFWYFVDFSVTFVNMEMYLYKSWKENLQLH